MRNDLERLLDILAAIDKIEQHISSDINGFADDEMQQVWVIHHLQIIGEAAYGLSQRIKAHHPEIPWEQIIGMRHVLVHGYFEIDLDIVWAVIEKDLRAAGNRHRGYSSAARHLTGLSAPLTAAAPRMNRLRDAMIAITTYVAGATEAGMGARRGSIRSDASSAMN